MEKNCLFCKIANGEIPAAKVYEDENVFAFLDIKPVNPGHALVITKEHYPTFLETPAEVLAKIAPTLQKVAAAVKKGCNADGVNVAVNNDRPAGQLVFHTHFHIIPRFVDDGLRHWGQKSYNNDVEVRSMAEKIRRVL